MIRTIRRFWVLAASGALAVAVGLTFRDFGITWDEGVQARYGELCLDYFFSGGSDLRYREYLDLRFYGPLIELLQALLYRPWPELRFDIRHLSLGLLAVGFVPALAAYARGFGRGAAAPLAVLALLMMPRLIGHATNNSKDIPFALAFCLCMACLARIFAAGRRDFASFAGLGLATGFALAVRPGGLPLLLAMQGLGAALAWAFVPAEREARALRRLALCVAAALALAWLAMVVAWPWAHESPIANPLAAIFKAADFDRSYPVLFEGEMLQSDRLSRFYLLKYLLITLPLPLIALAILGALGEWRTAARQAAPGPRIMLGLTLGWLLLPIAAATVLRPNLYDGMRHFLFVLPAAAVLAGLGAERLVRGLAGTPLARAAWPVAVAVLLLPLGSIVRLHPYQTSYFNAFVGGLAGASGRYETDYWATSLGEATRFVNARARERGAAPVVLLLGSMSPYPKLAVEYEADAGVRVVSLGELARHPEPTLHVDYYVAPSRYGMEAFFPEAEVVYRVEREGVSLAVVRDMRGGAVTRLPAAELPERPGSVGDPDR